MLAFVRHPVDPCKQGAGRPISTRCRYCAPDHPPRCRVESRHVGGVATSPTRRPDRVSTSAIDVVKRPARGIPCGTRSSFTLNGADWLRMADGGARTHQRPGGGGAIDVGSPDDEGIMVWAARSREKADRDLGVDIAHQDLEPNAALVAILGGAVLQPRSVLEPRRLR